MTNSNPDASDNTHHCSVSRVGLMDVESRGLFEIANISHLWLCCLNCGTAGNSRGRQRKIIDRHQ